MTVCPACGSTRVFRSRTRNVFERFRRQFSMKRPFRCHACNWRGWGTETEQVVSAEDLGDGNAAAPNLHAIDVSLEESRRKPDRDT